MVCACFCIEYRTSAKKVRRQGGRFIGLFLLWTEEQQEKCQEWATERAAQAGERKTHPPGAGTERECSSKMSLNLTISGISCV